MGKSDASLESYIRPPRRRLPMLGCLTLFLLFLAILLAAVAVAVKTSGGCELIAEYLQSHTGLALTIGEARLSLPCDLVLGEVSIKTDQAPEGDFRAREVSLGWRPRGSVLEVKGAQLNVVRTADGWMPEAFGRIAALRDVRETADLFADAPRRITVIIRDSSIFWHSPDGETKTFVQGLNFWSGVADTPTTTMRVYEVEALVVRRDGKLDGRSIERKWISLAGVPYVEILYKGLWDGDYRRAGDWWSIPEGH